ncbi:MAG: tRNA (adenosine(37)-N6)-dimethylallyltransferase MiaA, partial [Acidobacteriota bacterium]
MKITSPPVLLVVVGPTASGKTDLAHEVALRRGGEIVSADAFAVYRGLDVGTAKPSPERRREVPYHLLDVADARETYSAGRWAREAREVVDDVARRGRLPIVCGGSGFYLSALLEGLPPEDAADPALRSALAAWGRPRPEAAHRFLELNDPVSAHRIPPANLRYTLRALEILLATGRRASERPRPGGGWTARWRIVKVGIAPSRDDLYARIAHRVGAMLDSGWTDEVRRLIDEGVPFESQAFQAIGYREVAEW